MVAEMARQPNELSDVRCADHGVAFAVRKCPPNDKDVVVTWRGAYDETRPYIKASVNKKQI